MKHNLRPLRFIALYTKIAVSQLFDRQEENEHINVPWGCQSPALTFLGFETCCRQSIAGLRMCSFFDIINLIGGKLEFCIFNPMLSLQRAESLLKCLARVHMCTVSVRLAYLKPRKQNLLCWRQRMKAGAESAWHRQMNEQLLIHVARKAPGPAGGRHSRMTANKGLSHQQYCPRLGKVEWIWPLIISVEIQVGKVNSPEEVVLCSICCPRSCPVRVSGSHWTQETCRRMKRRSLQL